MIIRLLSHERFVKGFQHAECLSFLLRAALHAAAICLWVRQGKPCEDEGCRVCVPACPRAQQMEKVRASPESEEEPESEEDEGDSEDDDEDGENGEGDGAEGEGEEGFEKIKSAKEKKKVQGAAPPLTGAACEALLAAESDMPKL